jgi:hypothetical protein
MCMEIGGKACEIRNKSVPSSAKVKNEWRVTAVSTSVFMARCTVAGTVTVACS